MLLLIGIHSKIGADLGARLLLRGERVRVLVRSDASRAVLEQQGYQVVQGDLSQPGTLRRAMTGIELVFLLSSPSSEGVTWHKNVINAAKDASVAHLVRSSIMGADPESRVALLRQHGLSDRYLEDSDISYTILRPNYFSQNVIEVIAPVLQAKGHVSDPYGNARISMVDTRDVAAAAEVVLTNSGHTGMTYNLTGPEALSFETITLRLSGYIGHPIQHVALSDEAYEAALLEQGLDPWLAKAYLELVQTYRASSTTGFAAEVTSDIQKLTSLEPTSLDVLLEDFSHAHAALR